MAVRPYSLRTLDKGVGGYLRVDLRVDLPVHLPVDLPVDLLVDFADDLIAVSSKRVGSVTVEQE